MEKRWSKGRGGRRTRGRNMKGEGRRKEERGRDRRVEQEAGKG